MVALRLFAIYEISLENATFFRGKFSIFSIELQILALLLSEVYIQQFLGGDK